eukprot:UC1_evm1s264
MEFWTGWFDHWGEEGGHQTRDASQISAVLKAILDRGASVNLYMAVGGTNFGLMNGANDNTGHYEATVTSYDYDAPIGEDGRLTKKFYAFRRLFAQARGLSPDSLPPIPAPPGSADSAAAVAYPASQVHMTGRRMSLFDVLVNPAMGDRIFRGSFATPLHMEMLDQSIGFVLYSVQVEANGAHTVEMLDVSDRAHVFVDRNLAGVVERGRHRIDVPGYKREQTWDAVHVAPEQLGIVFDPESDSQTVEPNTYTLRVLVENTGRVNYGKPPLLDRKGLAGLRVRGAARVTSDKIDHYAIDVGEESGILNTIQEILAAGKSRYGLVGEQELPSAEPSFTLGYLQQAAAAAVSDDGLLQPPHDTHLLTENWGHGIIAVNGRVLGRYDPRTGPTRSLYLPGPWLADNVDSDKGAAILVFETD